MAIRTAQRIGIPQREFWGLTPYLLRIRARQWAEDDELAYQRQIAAAWHVEALRRTKKLPPLKTILPTRKPETVGDKLKGFMAQFRRDPNAKDGDAPASGDGDGQRAG